MLLVSQNLIRYNLPITEDVVLRYNLAWVKDLHELEKSILKVKNDVFIDIPYGRKKPPDNKYDVHELKGIVDRNSNVKYIAISNVELPEEVAKVNHYFNRKITIVPKIETLKGIDNIMLITRVMDGKRIIMLDHEDLFSDLVKNGKPNSMFFEYIERLSIFCESHSIKLLKVRGVIFSDKDEYNYE